MKSSKILILYFFLLKLGYICLGFFVFFTRGDSWFVNKKLKIGALIIAFTSIFACSSPKTVPPTVTCYTPQPHDNKKDSLAMVKKNNDDSIVNITKDIRKKDSVAINKKNVIKKENEIQQPTCYSKANFNK